MNMKISTLLALFLCGFIGTTRAVDDKPAAADADRQLRLQIKELVSQLDAGSAAERDAAEKQLLEVAGTETDEVDLFLAALPKDSDQMPLVVRDRLSRIRRRLEDRVAKVSTGATKVTLSAKSMPLADVFKAIEEQTGNKIVNNRDEQEEGASGPTITIELKDEPFWSAVDQILDQAQLGVYSYGGEEALSVVARSDADGPRHGRAAYQGPLRFEVLDVQAQRSLRQPNQKSLKFQLEVGWEPRIRPIALSQPVADIDATTDDGGKLTVSQPDAVQDVEVPTGTQAAEIVLPFDLPGRDVKKITSLRGKLHALVPGRQAKFEFKDLLKAAGKTQRLGGVQVTLDDVRKNNAIWEVHIRFALDDSNAALQSHRGWVFQNLSYLTDKDGERIENAGFETTRQTQKEIGIAYLFDVPDGLDGLTWVYETPAAIVDLPVEYVLNDIELP